MANRLTRGVAARPFATGARRSPPLLAVFAAALISTSSATAAKAETPTSRAGLVTCKQWLSNPASVRDGEIWIYGFWDGIVQGFGHPDRIGQIPHSDLMLDDVRNTCKDRPLSTLAESAFLAFERMRQGAFTPLPTGK